MSWGALNLVLWILLSACGRGGGTFTGGVSVGALAFAETSAASIPSSSAPSSSPFSSGMVIGIFIAILLCLLQTSARQLKVFNSGVDRRIRGKDRRRALRRRRRGYYHGCSFCTTKRACATDAFRGRLRNAQLPRHSVSAVFSAFYSAVIEVVRF